MQEVGVMILKYNRKIGTIEGTNRNGMKVLYRRLDGLCLSNCQYVKLARPNGYYVDSVHLRGEFSLF